MLGTRTLASAISLRAYLASWKVYVSLADSGRRGGAGGGTYLAVDHNCSIQDGHAGSVDLDSGAGDALEHDGVFVKLLTKGPLAGVVEAGDKELEGAFGLAMTVSWVAS